MSGFLLRPLKLYFVEVIIEYLSSESQKSEFYDAQNMV